jgi:hypothetical protein
VEASVAVLPHRSYVVVVVGSWDGLVPPPVMAPAGPTEQTRSAHSRRPWHVPVPVGPEQAAARLGVRRGDVDRLIRLGRIRSPQTIEIRFGTSRTGAVDVPLCTTADIDTVITARPEIHREHRANHSYPRAGRFTRRDGRLRWQ